MKRLRSLSLAACLVGFSAPIARSGDEFEHAPISYYDTESQDPVARLWKEMESGQRKLEPDEKGEYLQSLLDALKVPIESQCLVFRRPVSRSITYHRAHPERSISMILFM